MQYVDNFVYESITEKYVFFVTRLSRYVTHDNLKDRLTPDVVTFIHTCTARGISSTAIIPDDPDMLSKSNF